MTLHYNPHPVRADVCEHLVPSYLDHYGGVEFEYIHPDSDQRVYLCVICASENGYCTLCGAWQGYNTLVSEHWPVIVEMCDKCAGGVP